MPAETGAAKLQRGWEELCRRAEQTEEWDEHATEARIAAAAGLVHETSLFAEKLHAGGGAAALSAPAGSALEASELRSPPRDWPGCFSTPALKSFIMSELGGRKVRLCEPAEAAPR